MSYLLFYLMLNDQLQLIIAIMIKVVLLVLLPLALAIEIKVIANDLPHNQQSEVFPVKLSINANSKYIYPAQYNTFTLPTLPIGRNVVEVISTYQLYPILMIDTKSSGQKAYHFVHPVTKNIIQKVSDPIYIKPIDQLQYLFEEPGFSIVSMLFSGTGMFVMFGVTMYFCYSKLMPKLEEAQMAPQAVTSQKKQ